MNQQEYEKKQQRDALRQQAIIAAQKTIENNWLYFYERFKDSKRDIKRIAINQLFEAFKVGLELGERIGRGKL